VKCPKCNALMKHLYQNDDCVICSSCAEIMFLTPDKEMNVPAFLKANTAKQQSASVEYVKQQLREDYKILTLYRELGKGWRTIRRLMKYDQLTPPISEHSMCHRFKEVQIEFGVVPKDCDRGKFSNGDTPKRKYRQSNLLFGRSAHV
jgi:hypothetical protein